MSHSEPLLDWIKTQTPDYDWNLKGDPQGITLVELSELALSQRNDCQSTSDLAGLLFEHRMWFHLTDEEGHQIDQPRPPEHTAIWISVRSTPWAS